jgi:hypothetical protein
MMAHSPLVNYQGLCVFYSADYQHAGLIFIVPMIEGNMNLHEVKGDDVMYSFYYIVPEQKSVLIREQLITLNIPFDSPADNVGLFLFPDLPVRQYAKVRELFEGDGIPVKANLKNRKA